MILDHLENSESYSALSVYFKDAFDFLKSSNIAALEDGKFSIKGDDLFCMISTQNGKKKEEAKLEFHKEYIDIHFTLSGSDTIGWKSLKDCREIEKEYDSQKDFGIFSDTPSNWITLNPGEFALFFPNDAHAPLVSEKVIHKAVIKLAVKAAF